MTRGFATAFLALGIALSVTACSMFGGKVAEEPAYRVLLEDGDIELRRYAGYAVARTTAPAPYDEAVRTGFRRLFDYISGANRDSAKIAMTAPVIVTPESGGMLVGRDAGGWSTGFVLPEGYTATTAPAPEDGGIVIGAVGAGCVAVLRYSGILGNETAETERRALVAWLDGRGLAHAGDWRMAGYNPPWTIPALRRNEVLVTLASCP